MRRHLLWMLTFILVFSQLVFGETPSARFYKAECGTSAGYIKLAANGTYAVIWREHVGVFQEDGGRWNQNGGLITFSPRNPSKKSYEATEITYRGKTFLAWKSDDAAGIVIPPEETQQELDRNPEELPYYVFFQTTSKTYARETKMTYPFRYVCPSCPADKAPKKSAPPARSAR